MEQWDQQLTRSTPPEESGSVNKIGTGGENKPQQPRNTTIKARGNKPACAACTICQVECDSAEQRWTCSLCEEKGLSCDSWWPAGKLKAGKACRVDKRRDAEDSDQSIESDIDNPEKLPGISAQLNTSTFPFSTAVEYPSCNEAALPRIRADEPKAPAEPIKVSEETPIELVAEHFRKTARLYDYTIELNKSISQDSFPIFRSVLGDIYKVKVSDGSQVAVKCVRCVSHEGDKSLKRSASELEAWRNLSHENIHELRGFAIFRGKLAMISPWMANGNVIEYLDHHPEVDRYQICKQLASVVMYLHDQDVVHGDLKGGNILVSDEGKLKLTDFGLSIMHQSRLDFSDTDLAGGTLRWQAPELMAATGQRSKEADVYALGMTMLEIVTGKPPFEELDFSNVRNLVAVADQGLRPKRPIMLLDMYSSVGGHFWQILESCWMHDPHQRATSQQVYSSTLALSTVPDGPGDPLRSPGSICTTYTRPPPAIHPVSSVSTRPEVKRDQEVNRDREVNRIDFLLEWLISLVPKCGR